MSSSIEKSYIQNETRIHGLAKKLNISSLVPICNDPKQKYETFEINA